MTTIDIYQKIQPFSGYCFPESLRGKGDKGASVFRKWILLLLYKGITRINFRNCKKILGYDLFWNMSSYAYYIFKGKKQFIGSFSHFILIGKIMLLRVVLSLVREESSLVNLLLQIASLETKLKGNIPFSLVNFNGVSPYILAHFLPHSMSYFPRQSSFLFLLRRLLKVVSVFLKRWMDLQKITLHLFSWEKNRFKKFLCPFQVIQKSLFNISFS